VAHFFFGPLTDRWGRKKLFIITLGIYLVGSGIAGLAWAPWFLYIWRFVAGMGIGGEYTTNSFPPNIVVGSRFGDRPFLLLRHLPSGRLVGAVDFR
jgi:MFS family permease